eukprot:sb/3461840/
MLVLVTLLTGLASLLEASYTAEPDGDYTRFPYRTVTMSPIQKCELTEVNGYLHEKCLFLYNDKYYLKCPRSDFVYRRKSEGSHCYSVEFSKLCPSDPGFYQACGHGGCTGYKELIDGTPLLCGTYLCDSRSHYDYRGGDYSETVHRCRNGYCYNTKLNMVGCSNGVNENTKCDGKCDDNQYCEDESLCNGVQYGLNYCVARYFGGFAYIPPMWICNGDNNCEDGEDVVGCSNWTVADHTTCQHSRSGKIIRIQDNMRCFHPDYSACPNRQDQTNCSDPERVAMQCLSQGFPATISKWGYCQGYKLCDDEYNNVCIDPELGCNIHKGQLCDGHRDCNQGGDETNCVDLTKVSCIRRFHSPNGKKNVSLQIPLDWVMDGEQDCLDGVDEDETQWLKCGKDYYARYQEKGSECKDVLLCPAERDFIDLDNLCDTINTCSFEEKLCKAARQTDVDVTSLDDSFVNGHEEQFIQHCFPFGASDLERKLGKCHTVEHTAGFVKTVLNVQQPVFVSIPETKVDCSYLFGVNYVYAACNNICLNAECPLKKIPGDTCVNKQDSVVRALADTAIPSKTTLMKTANIPGFYHNKIFPCDNNNCVSYRDVCNLKDNCGDGSDEKVCQNHFQCNNSKILELVVLSQVCDGVVHCHDFSDECFEGCRPTNKNIFGTEFLRSASPCMGFLATSLNTVSLIKSVWELRQQETYEMFLNKSAIILIHLGDLMIGVYLLLISYFDFIYRADGNYCQEKYQWFSSSECSSLGVLSTTGSQLSLFAMTMLSLTRVANIGNLIQRDLFTYKSAARLMVLLVSPILASVVIAVIPILSLTEDYFVNGLYYYRSTLFIRPASKINHYEVFKEYFGGGSVSWEKTSFSWSVIRSTMKDIFSSDYQGKYNVTSHVYAMLRSLSVRSLSFGPV